jgi:auxin influx carrier (AUX1 LAX family)
MGRLSQVVVYTSLVGIAAVQIIATASNFYLLEDRLSKRTWSLVWGAAFCCMLFIPTFRHYRLMSIFGLLTTTYVSWFMTVESLSEGRDEGVTYTAPTSMLNYFRGMVSQPATTHYYYYYKCYYYFLY